MYIFFFLPFSAADNFENGHVGVTYGQIVIAKIISHK